MKWLLLHADPPGIQFLPQLNAAKVIGQCSCGCPTVDLEIPSDIASVEIQRNPIVEAVGEVGGNMVGVMLLQAGGRLACLEVYDLSELKRPYGLPSLESLRSWENALR